MADLYLQNIVNDIRLEDLPEQWQDFDFSRFLKTRHCLTSSRRHLKTLCVPYGFSIKIKTQINKTCLTTIG